MKAKDEHWIEHYKNMTLAEIVLLDAYLLLADEQGECWKTIRQMEELLPMSRHTVINAKRALIEKGWITRIQRTGVQVYHNGRSTRLDILKSLRSLKSIRGYPFDLRKDLPFVKSLLADFPTLDLEEEIKDWGAWLLDRESDGNANYRLRLRKWLKNSKEKQNGENKDLESSAYPIDS